MANPQLNEVSDQSSKNGTARCKQTAENVICKATNISGLIAKAPGSRLFKTAPAAQLMLEMRENAIPNVVLPEPKAGMAKNTAPSRPINKPK
jgi:hypothetical protein